MARLGVRLDFAPSLSAQDMSDLALLAERRGYETVWVPEGVGRDALTQLAAFAERTQRVKLGTGILPIFHRSPTLLAMSAFGMATVSNHRFILGLGVGHAYVVEGMHGIPFQRPLRRVRETVEIVRRLLRGEEVDYEGQVFSLSGARVGSPSDLRDVPIYLAALGPQMIELAGEIADGVLLNWASNKYISIALEHLRRDAARVGRDPEEIDVACYIRVMVTEDLEAAQPSLRCLLGRYANMPAYRKLFEQMGYSEEAAAIAGVWARGDREAPTVAVSEAMLRDLAVVGPADYCLQEIEARRALGLKSPVVAPFAAAEAKNTYRATIEAFSGDPEQSAGI